MIRLKGPAVKILTVVLFFSLTGAAFVFFSEEVTALFLKTIVYSADSYMMTVDLSVKNEAEPVETIQAEQKEEKSEDVTVAASKKKDTSLTKTDSDIAALIKKAQKNASGDKKDGEIKEYTFTTDGVTDSFQNVRVKNTNKTDINIEKKLNEIENVDINKNEPSVLIYHTHTTETYQILDRDFYATGFLSRSSDEARNMVRVGKAVKQQLEKAGYKVIHDTRIYDNPYTGAYYRSEDSAEEYLKKYPSIKITLDIHRDAIQDDYGVKTKPVASVNGKKAAQIMIITGCQEEGNGITDLPEWEKNLTFALKLQQKMETAFPGLTRPVFFCNRSYNMGLTPQSLLVEVGSDANTLDEAVYSGKMLGSALASLMKDYEENQSGN